MIAAFMVIASQAEYVEPKDAAVQLDEPNTVSEIILYFMIQQVDQLQLLWNKCSMCIVRHVIGAQILGLLPFQKRLTFSPVEEKWLFKFTDWCVKHAKSHCQ